MSHLIHDFLSRADASIAGFVERHPVAGYVPSIASITTGLAGLLETATKIGGFLSVCLGIGAGFYALRVQRRNWAKAQSDEAAQNEKKIRQQSHRRRY